MRSKISPEDDHDLVQQLLELLLTGLLVTRSEFRVDKLRNHLRGFVLTLVYEAFKCVLQ